MKLQLYNPFRELDRRLSKNFWTDFFDRDIEKFWGNFVDDKESYLPVADIKETDNAYELACELPGLEKKDITLDVKDNYLTIKGEKKIEKDEKKDNFHKIERSYGSFCRSFNIPQNVKAENIKAQMKNGILKVSLPKKEAAKSKSISINVEQ